MTCSRRRLSPRLPPSISASAGADVLCSPVKGKVIKMADVPDPVFGGEVLGKGCAVWPEDDLVYAPCDGKVTVTMGHAVGLQSDSGIEVLVHVGVDTVNMNGDGFEGFVKADDVVKAGQPILKIDRAKIAAAGYKDCVVVAVSNTAEFADVALTVEVDSDVAAGDGHPLGPPPRSPPVTSSLRSSASKLRRPKDVQGWSGFPATFFIAPRESVLLHVGRACKPFGR